MHMKLVKKKRNNNNQMQAMSMFWVYMHRGSERASDWTDVDTAHSHSCRRTRNTQLFTYSLNFHQNDTQ